MTTDFHTPWQDGVTEYKAAHMNAPLGELDEAIGELSDEVDGKSDTTHNHALNNLSEKNYSSLSGRPADDNFNGLSAVLSGEDSDTIPIYSSGEYKKITKENFLEGLGSAEYLFNGFTELTLPENDDTLPIYDTNTSTYKKITKQNLFQGIGVVSGEFPYDIGITFPDVPTDELVLLRYPFPRTVQFAADMTPSRAVAGTAATSSSVFSLKKNGSQFATITFAGSGTVGSFSGEATQFTTSDVLTLVCPASADATLADLGFALSGIR